MKTISLFAAVALLGTAPLLAEEVLSGTISIANTTTTANRTIKAVPVKKTPAKTKIITAKTIRERGYRTLPEALSYEAGLNVSANGGPGQTSAIFLRGMSSSDVLVMIDGVPMVDYTQPSPAPFNLEGINLDNVEKIEVIKGAQSGAWGANAVAGVINIITQKARKDYADISIGAGSYGTHDWGFSTSQAGDWGSFLISHHHSHTDGFSAVAPASAEADSYTYDSTLMKTTLNAGDGSTVDFFANTYADRFDYDSGFPANPNDTLGKGTTHRHSFGLGYTYDKGGEFALRARATLNTIDRKLDGAFGPFATQGDRTALSLVSTYRFASNHSLSLGLEHSTVSGGTTYAPSSQFSNDALFAHYHYTAENLLGAQTTFNASLRYDHFDAFADKATYRFGIKRNCTALPRLHSAANIYSAYKAPSLYQLANTSGTLRPEYTQGFDLSVGYRNWLTVTYFRNTTTDKITNTAVWPAPTSYANASGEEKVSGLELEGRYDLSGTGFGVGFNATHLFESHLVRRAQNSGNLFVDYHVNPQSNLNLSLHYVGARDAYDGSTLPAYKTLNATLTTRLKNHVDLTFGVKNILGAKYETAKGYATAGRSVYARIKYRF